MTVSCFLQVVVTVPCFLQVVFDNVLFSAVFVFDSVLFLPDSGLFV